mmetsp:Transcript_14710/g.31540  ORF Transcript_14710/g.31540 Transcript_14710/m.31540 type:complete len:223 (+) Transcript_14710:1150-1818(+)
MTRTFSELRWRYSFGTRTPGEGTESAADPPGPYSRSKSSRLLASFSKSSSSKRREQNSSTAATASARTMRWPSAPWMPSTALAPSRSSRASAAIISRSPGRCTLTATGRPPTTALYTEQREAAATGVAESDSISPGAWLATISRAVLLGIGGTLSCSICSSAASLTPTMSGREASACPNLTKVGPMRESVSASAAYLPVANMKPIADDITDSVAARFASLPG